MDQAETIVNANFDNGTDGFTFIGNRNDPDYSSGERDSNELTNNSQALITVLGGVDNTRVRNIFGSWSQTFTTTDGSFTLSLDANLIQASDYEANEFSQIGIIIDGQRQPLDTITGDGNGGPVMSSGLQTYTIPLDLAAGEHTLSLACFNNQKTLNNETTTCVFDNILIE